MSYEIRKTNGAVLITLDEGLTDNTLTPLTLIGKNVAEFGKSQNENFVRLLENFSNSFAPSPSVKGQLWFNESTEQLSVKTSTGFKTIGPFPDVSTPSLNATGTNVVATTAWVHQLFPKGMIMMWSGSVATIPYGWALCDGFTHNGVGTPNLTDKFIMGAGNLYTPGDTGGQNYISSVPAHNHSFSASTTANNQNHTHSGVTQTAGAHKHGYPGDDQLSFGSGTAGWTANSLGGFPYDARSSYGGGAQIWETTQAGSHNHTFTTGNESTGHAHNVSGDTSTTGTAVVSVLNPYYALAYIMKVI